MRRFFFKDEERNGEYVTLSDAESHHIRAVLRLRTGTPVELFDGRGGVHRAELVQVGDRAVARILASRPGRDDGFRKLWVGQGLLKAKTMDMVVQKATELGVDKFFPFIAERCQGRPDEVRDVKKHWRWSRIVEEACKQCGRPQPMEVAETTGFRDVVGYSPAEPKVLKILFWEEEKSLHIRDLLPLADNSAVWALLGPEGGFTGSEVDAARECGWRSVSLGSRILRAETATLASVAILQYFLGGI